MIWNKAVETLLAQCGNRSDDKKTGSISTPLYFSTTYRHQGLGKSTGYDYSRMHDPTRDILEDTLAKAENGIRSFAVSSGMAAIQLAFSKFHSGDHIIVLDDLYGGSYRYFDLLHDNYGLQFSQWNGQDTQQLRNLLLSNTKAIFIETPSNPMMKKVDINKTANIAHQYGAQLIVDNTFYTPLLQQPLKKGADIVVHSATKYLSGHNDLLGGFVVVKHQSDADIYEQNLITTGSNLDPFDSWLLIRSLKTLPVRLKQQIKNTKDIVNYLKCSNSVCNILYPGNGGMVCFYVKDSIDIDKFLRHLQVISFAESLGGVESLITVPYTQTHANLSVKERHNKGITMQLLRLSCGLEASGDLIHDLDDAFKYANNKTIVERGKIYEE